MRLLRFLMLSLLAVGVMAQRPFTSHASIPSDNLLNNGGFENGSSGWFCVGSCSLTAVSTPTHSGSQAVLASNRSQPFAGPGQQITTPLANGGSYFSQAWGRLPAGSGSLRVKITLQLNSSSGTSFIAGQPFLLSDSEWRPILAALTPTWSGTLQEAIWWVESIDGLDSYLLDDAELHHIPQPETVSSVVVQPSQRQQTVRELAAGNFVPQFPQTFASSDPVAAFNINNLNMSSNRVSMGLEDWEPVNDNNNSQDFNFAAFQDTAFNHDIFLLLQRFEQQGMEITASAWDVPDWMVENPTAENGRVIRRELYDEAIESMAAWLLWARDRYGVTVDYVSFNEVNDGNFIFFEAADLANFMVAAGERFQQLGLPTKWLLGDCPSMFECAEYSATVWAETAVRPHIAAFAVHSWDSDAPDAVLHKLAAFAAATGLDIHVSEGGWDPLLWQRPQEFPTWDNALNLATIYSRLLKYGRATSFYYWQMVAGDYQLNTGSAGFPAFFVLQQLGNQVPPGSHIVATSANGRFLHTFAADTPTGFVVHLINSGSLSQTVTIAGLPNSSYSQIQSREGVLGTAVGNHTVIDGTATITLAPRSINLLVSSSPPPPLDPAVYLPLLFK